MHSALANDFNTKTCWVRESINKEGRVSVSMRAMVKQEIPIRWVTKYMPADQLHNFLANYWLTNLVLISEKGIGRFCTAFFNNKMSKQYV